MSKYASDLGWRTGLLVAVLAMLFAVAGLYALNFDLFSVVIHDFLSGQASPVRVFAAPFDISNVWFAFLFGMASIPILISALRARLRMRQRSLAIAGKLAAIPLADPKTTGASVDQSDETPLPDWTSAPEPLRLGWREQRYTRQRWAPIVGCLGVFGALTAAGLSIWAVVVFLLPLNDLPSGAVPFVVLAIPLAVCLVVGIPVWRAAMRLANAGPTPARDENELIANDAGLAWLRPGHPAVYMSWAGARLFEVALTFPGKDTPAWRAYTLWGADGRSIAWPVFNAGSMTTQHDAADELARVALAYASRALLRLIHERTGLTARTFDVELLADARQAQPWYSTVILEPTAITPVTAPIMYLLGGILLFCALALPLLPLTSILWVNIYGALSLLLVGLLSARTLQRWRRSGRRRADAALSAFALQTAPASPGADALFTLAQRPSLARALAVWLLAPSCILDGVVALVAIIMPGSHYGDMTLGSTLVFTTIAVLVVTALGGVVGLLYGIANGGPRRIVAGPERLSMGHEGAVEPQVSILWPKVTAIIAITRRDGRVIGYRVEGASVIVTPEISWRHDPRSVIAAPSPRPLLQHAQPITPDELAALVVARTGLPLQAREA